MFRETSENFQTGSLSYTRPLVESDRAAFTTVMGDKPHYRKLRNYSSFDKPDGEQTHVSTPLQHFSSPPSADSLFDSILANDERLQSKGQIQASIVGVAAGGSADLAITAGARCASEAKVPAYLKKRKSIIKVYNTDALCGQRCLVLGLLHSNLERRKNIVRPARSKQFTKAAEALAVAIGHHEEMTFTDFEKFTSTHPGYSVWVWNTVNEAVYSCGEGTAINIYYDRQNAHYHFIANPDGLNHNKKLCPDCRKPIRGDRHHVCAGKHKCSHCLEQFDTDKGLREHRTQLTKAAKLELCCPDCNQWGQTAECSAKHQESCAGKLWMCHPCHAKDWRNAWVKPEDKETHFDGEGACRLCTQHRGPPQMR